ncbi:MAG: response regulator [Betaproteobacteria bacterium]
MHTRPGSGITPSFLIVEDHAPMRAALREFILQRFPGADIIEEHSGAGAVDKCLCHDPDVVLMDIALPAANGLMLTAEIKKHATRTKVIATSSHTSPIYRERAQSAGADLFVPKDSIFSQLADAIAIALAQPVPSVP